MPFEKPMKSILALPRASKRLIVLIVDSCLCILTVWLAYYLRLGEFVSLAGNALLAVWVSLGVALPIFILAGLYRAIFRFSGWAAFLVVAKSIGLYGLIYAVIFTAIGVADVPRTVGIIQPILLLLFVGASRAFARFWLGDSYRTILKQADRPKVLIYGAGTSGRQLAGALAGSSKMQVAGFLDDDNRLHGQWLNGLPIYNPADLSDLNSSAKINDVLLAMPSISRKRRNEILNQIRLAHVSVRTLPSLVDLVQGKVKISDLHELDIDDLLGRDSVDPNADLLAKNITNKTVLVTGAGGSIGSELCRQIFSLKPSCLLLVEQSEFALYSVHQELEAKLGDQNTTLVPLIASVQDIDRMRSIMATWQPDTVYHAAAYKHVPLVEHNPVEGIRNNVLGTLKTAQAALENGVCNFVLISTDKAVRPTNIMGASKRLAEMILQALAADKPSTKFTMVRFGNVLGSSGSVVPKFRQQIREGGPITLTHREITRFFMTIPEAAQLVIQAGAMADGGDVFVLDMGNSVRIYDLACRMIDLSGLTIKDDENPEGDIEILITGLRPGEKLYEELLIGDNPEPTNHPRVMRAREGFIDWAQLEPRLEALQTALHTMAAEEVQRIMLELVLDYAPNNQLVDWVSLKNKK